MKPTEQETLDAAKFEYREYPSEPSGLERFR